MEIHVKYEEQPQYPLESVEKEPFTWRVEKMKLSKDKTTLIYNDVLTLNGIPPDIASATAPPSNGSWTSIRSRPTSAAASSTIPIAQMIFSTSCAW